MVSIVPTLPVLSRWAQALRGLCERVAGGGATLCPAQHSQRLKQPSLRNERRQNTKNQHQNLLLVPQELFSTQLTFQTHLDSK